MAELGFDDGASSAAGEPPGQLLLECQGVEAVGVDTGHLDVRRHSSQCSRYAATAPAYIMAIHRFAQDQVRIGVEPGGKFPTMVFEI